MGPRRLPRLRLRRIRARRGIGLRRPRLPRIPFRQSLTKLPNLLTYFRIAAIPAVLWLVHQTGVRPGEEQQAWAWAATAGFCLAAATDFADGWIARRRNLTTLLGRFLDPVADKLLVMALLVELVALGRIPSWIAIVLIAREMFINGLRAIALGEGFEVPVVPLGKLKTTFQFCGIVGLLLHFPLELPILPFALPSHEIGFALLVIATALSVASGGIYLRNFVREELRRERT